MTIRRRTMFAAPVVLVVACAPDLPERMPRVPRAHHARYVYVDPPEPVPGPPFEPLRDRFDGDAPPQPNDPYDTAITAMRISARQVTQVRFATKAPRFGEAWTVELASPKVECYVTDIGVAEAECTAYVDLDKIAGPLHITPRTPPAAIASTPPPAPPRDPNRPVCCTNPPMPMYAHEVAATTLDADGPGTLVTVPRGDKDFAMQDIHMDYHLRRDTSTRDMPCTLVARQDHVTRCRLDVLVGRVRAAPAMRVYPDGLIVWRRPPPSDTVARILKREQHDDEMVFTVALGNDSVAKDSRATVLLGKRAIGFATVIRIDKTTSIWRAKITPDQAATAELRVTSSGD